MNKIKYLITGLCSVALLSACLKDYQDLNTDPEKLGETNPAYIFTGATLHFNNSQRAHLTGKYDNMVRMQYLVGSGGAADGSYVSPTNANDHTTFNAQWYSDYYNLHGLYLDHLINTVLPSQENPEQYASMSAIAQILLTYKQWQILETYGAAPITEAFRSAEGNLAPKYDLYQKSIDGEPMYKVLDANLKEAVATLKASDDSQVNLGSSDFFYNGDVDKWIKAANTIRVKMAQRLEKADAAFYNEVISEVLASASNVMGSHAESLIYWEPSDYDNNTDDRDRLTYGYVASAAFVNFLKAYDDPRLPIMVRRNGIGDGNNNELNDNRFANFIREYPDYVVGRKVDKDSVLLDLSLFADRYVGLTANPINTGTAIGSIINNNKNLSAIPYQPIDPDTKAPQVDENNDPIYANMDIRLYSQIESRFFVKNGGSKDGSNMPAYDIEDDKFVVTGNDIHWFNPILTYPEACFMFAEIAFKKGGAVAGKDASGWYQAGIKAAIEQVRDWAVRMYVVPQVSDVADLKAPITDDAIAAYAARPEFQSVSLEKIISQQWINLFMQPEEMWATWKRTGLPAFAAAEVAKFDAVKFDDKGKPTTTIEQVNGVVLGPQPVDGVAYWEEIKTGDNLDLIIPRRLSLTAPNSLNMDNYNAAIEELKKDAKYGSSFNTTTGRIWWDVE